LKRQELENLISKKLKDLSKDQLQDVLKIVLTMAFKEEKNLKDYSFLLEDIDTEEARHIREEFINYQKIHRSD
jgi:transcription termination factor NusB